MTASAGGRLRRVGTGLLLGLILFAALALRYRGVAWPSLHPDEPTIAGWAHWIEDHPYISERFYAGGFFQLVKPAVWLRTMTQEWGQAWRGFIGDPGSPAPPSASMILFLRTLNVWMAALTALVFFWLARRVTGSTGAALAAAAFLAFSRLNVDHSHYAETDIAMLLTVSAALALWARVHERRRLAGFLLAAFVTGWAIGTKFTMGMLLANVIAGAVAVGRGGADAGPARPVRRAVGVGLAGLLLCVLAIVFTNQGLADPGWFVPKVSSGLASVYGERAGLLNEDASLAAAWRANANTLRDGFAGLGWGWLCIMALGLSLSWKPAYRRYWPVTWMFPALYGVYCLWIAPWIRGQEFMGFYPAFAAWLAIGVSEAAAVARRAPAPRFALVLVYGAIVAAGWGPAVDACRSASQFGYPDPRMQAMEWVSTHAPLDAVTGIENYTTPAERLFAHGEDIGQIEWTSRRKTDQLKLEYLLRNSTSRGRGTVDPRTRQLWPEYAANLRDFEARAALLCRWGAMGESPYAFAGHRMEWWQVLRGQPQATLSVPLFRPVLLAEGRERTVPAAGCDLGSVGGVWVDSKPRRLVINGPASDHRTLYVVLQTVDRAAEVKVSLSACRRRVNLGPYDVAVVPVRRPAWMPRWQEYDVVEVRAKPIEHLRAIPCYAQVAFSPEEAALLLYQKGYPDRALALLKAESVAGPDAAWLSFICAAAEGDWELAGQAEGAARAILEQLRAARDAAPAAVVVNGFTGAALRDHRRIRLPVGRYDGEAGRWTVATQTLELQRCDDRPGYEADWRLPVRLARGHYRIGFTVAAPRRGAGDPPWRLTFREVSSPNVASVALAAGDRARVTCEVRANAEQDCALRLASDMAGGPIEVSEIEVRWGDDDLFGFERIDLLKAFCRHALHKGDSAAARAALEEARAAGADGDLALDRLELELLRSDPARLAEARQAARRILGRAPAYGPALEVLAAEDAGARDLWNRLQGGTGPTVTLYPWLKIVGMATDAATKRRHCVVEVLRDGMPALKVRAWRTRDRRNRRYFEQELSRRPMMQGERLSIAIPPSPERGTYDGVWITFESPPYWLSAPLPAPGNPKGRIQSGP